MNKDRSEEYKVEILIWVRKSVIMSMQFSLKIILTVVNISMMKVEVWESYGNILLALLDSKLNKVLDASAAESGV